MATKKTLQAQETAENVSKNVDEKDSQSKSSKSAPKETAKESVKATTLSGEDLDEALKEAESYESNEDNFLSLAELGSKLLTQEGASKLALKEKRKIFTERGVKKVDGEVASISDKDDNYTAYLEIEASFQSGKNGRPPLFISAEVSGVEYTENMDNVLLICFMGLFEVKIPVSEYMWMNNIQASKYTDLSIEDLHKYAVMRIGSTCKFKVEAILPDKKVAYASRIKALGVEGFANYVRPQENGQPRYVVGQKVLATVVCVQDSFVICEANGAEFVIKDEELAWGGMTDVYKYFSIGDTFYVRIQEVNYSIVTMPTGAKYKKVDVVASKRLVESNPYDLYSKRYKPDMITTAYVTNVTDQGVTLALGTQKGQQILSVFSEYPLWLLKEQRPIKGDTVRVRVLRKNDEKKYIRVAIEKVLKRER